MEAPPGSVALAGGPLVPLDDEGAACWHWRAKGSCSFGEKCQRAATHVPIDGPPRGLYFMLYKTPREEPPQCLFRRTMTRNGLARTKDLTQAHLLWANILPAVSGNSQATHENAMLRKLLSNCRVNHFPRSFEITHKDKLYRNLRVYGPLQQESFLPRSFVLPDEAEACAREVAAVTLREGVNNSIWISKPDGLGEGRGIQVLRNPNLDTISNLTSYVIQRYISRPLLLPCNGKKDGLVRFAAAEYVCTGDTLADLSVHLCNNAVNRRVDERINSKNWSVSQLREYMLKESGFETAFQTIWEQIRFIAVSAVMCAASHIAPAVAQFFELLGMDILIDEDRRAWLCEVNHMPDIGCTSRKFSHVYKSDFKVKSRLLCDLLNILFPNGSFATNPLDAAQLGDFEVLSLSMARPCPAAASKP